MSSTNPALILVADDNEDNRNVLARRLKQQGHRVVMAADGCQALAEMRRQPFDLLLLDINMPCMDGYQVLEEMRADGTLRHLPVIVVSAIDDVESIARCIELGAQDYMTKPFNRVLLQARIGASLEKKRLRDQEQVLLAAAQAASEAKSRFISAVVHELNNALTPIQGYLGFLTLRLGPVLDEASNGFLRIIGESSARMATLVSDLSDVSRIEAGRLNLSLQSVSVPELVTTVAQALEPEITAHGQLLCNLVPGDLVPAEADPIRLAQVVANLLSNAHKYTPEGGIITIRAEALPGAAGQAPGTLHLSVQDTGIGIDPAEQDRIFQPFFRSNDEAVRRLPGLGLGLSISQKLVEMQGGHLWFESEPGRGTTFHFTLPADGVRPQPPGQDRVAMEEGEWPGSCSSKTTR